MTPSKGLMSVLPKASDVCGFSAGQLARAYSARELSPLEVTEAHLRRIREYDGHVGAYIAVDANRARADARAAEQRYRERAPAGPLDGVPVGIKDNIDVAGYATTGASRWRDGVPAREDAAAVARLRRGGVVVLGKLTLFEMAGGGGPPLETGFPIARNPRALERVTGGSSSGSAASVAAGLATLSVGTDSGGSVRFPAALCGVVGFKASAGLVPTAGVLPYSWSLDHVGPLARTASDVAEMYATMAGFDPSATIGDGASLAGLRVGVPESLLAGMNDLSPSVSAAFRSAVALLRREGAESFPVELPLAEHAVIVGCVILNAEGFATYEEVMRARPSAFGRRFATSMLEGAQLSSADYLLAQRAHGQLRRAMTSTMSSVDVLVMPTSPITAWAMSEDLAQAEPHWSPSLYLAMLLFNLTGQPAISVPCGLDEQGLPIGLQVAAARGADATALRTAQAFERARGAWDRP